MTSRKLARFVAEVAAWIVSLSLYAPVFAADSFQTNLGPSPLDDASKIFIQGRGAVIATLDGSKFTVRGTFGGLLTPATEAHLRLGLGIGIPGPMLFDLTVTPATDGTISGIFTLNSRQVDALKSGKIYIQLSSQKASDRYGNLWGWLLPAHEVVGQDVPQERRWFLPQDILLQHD